MGRDPGSILRPESGLNIGPESGARASRCEEFGRRVAKNLGAGFETQRASASRPKEREIQAPDRGQRQCPRRGFNQRKRAQPSWNPTPWPSQNVETQSARLLDPLQQTFQSSRAASPHRATLSDQRIEFKPQRYSFSWPDDELYVTRPPLQKNWSARRARNKA